MVLHLQIRVQLLVVFRHRDLSRRRGPPQQERRFGSCKTYVSMIVVGAQS